MTAFQLLQNKMQVVNCCKILGHEMQISVLQNECPPCKEICPKPLWINTLLNHVCVSCHCFCFVCCHSVSFTREINKVHLFVAPRSFVTSVVLSCSLCVGGYCMKKISLCFQFHICTSLLSPRRSFFSFFSSLSHQHTISPAAVYPWADGQHHVA